ncbi:MAG: riboflavin synthase [Salibacteraceae bacterium]
MFTGIIETLGVVTNLDKEESNLHISIKAKLGAELKVDQSVAHNGVCLTVVAIENETYTVTAIKETLEKTNLNNLVIGSKVNLERCLQFGGRIDGHVVQGHVDTTGQLVSVINENGSWLFTFTYPKEFDNLIIDKGSITVNGTSLTVVNPEPQKFSVAIIPYTYENTIFHTLKINDRVNLEFDVLGKYIASHMKAYNSAV